MHEQNQRNEQSMAPPQSPGGQFHRSMSAPNMDARWGRPGLQNGPPSGSNSPDARGPGLTVHRSDSYGDVQRQRGRGTPEYDSRGGQPQRGSRFDTPGSGHQQRSFDERDRNRSFEDRDKNRVYDERDRNRSTDDRSRDRGRDHERDRSPLANQRRPYDDRGRERDRSYDSSRSLEDKERNRDDRDRSTGRLDDRGRRGNDSNGTRGQQGGSQQDMMVNAEIQRQRMLAEQQMRMLQMGQPGMMFQPSLMGVPPGGNMPWMPPRGHHNF